MCSVSTNPFEPTEPAFWFWDRLDRETHGATSTENGMVEYLSSVTPKQDDTLQYRQQAVYAKQSTTSSGHIILEMTGLGKVDRVRGSQIHDEGVARYDLTRGTDESVEFPKCFKNAPPRFIILHPDGEEDAVYWGDFRGIAGWFMDQRRAIRCRTERTTTACL